MSDSTLVSSPGALPIGFRRKPFSGGDAEFFFTNTGYLDAYVRLLDGIRQSRGLMVLTGAAGTGKTLLLRKLTQEAPAQIKFVLCYSTNLDFDELLALICDRLALEAGGQDRPRKLKAVQEYLAVCRQQGVIVAVLIDEAHHLHQNVLSRLLTLLQLAINNGHPLQLVLSGAPALEEQVAQQQLHPIMAQAVHIRLERLSDADVAAFIQRQLQMAGGASEVFPAPVIARIAHYSQGIPRLINSLCDHALLIAQLYELPTLTPEMIDEAAGEMLLPARQKNSPMQLLPVALSPPEHRPVARQPTTPGQDLIARSDSGATQLVTRAADAGSMKLPEAAVPPSAAVGRGARSGLWLSLFLLILAGAAGAYLLTRHAADQSARNGLALLKPGPAPTNPTTPILATAKYAPAELPLGTAVPVQPLEPQPVATATPAASQSAPAVLDYRPPEAPTTTMTAPQSAAPEAAPALPPAEPSEDKPASAQAEPAPAGGEAAAPPAEAAGPATPPEPVTAEAAPTPAPPAAAEERNEPAPAAVPIADYMQKGDRLLELGDTASARLFYEAAAQAGHSKALTAVGKTYDPRVLGGQGLQGVYADPGQAEQWYAKAAQAGDPEAADYLTQLRRWLAQPPPPDTQSGAAVQAPQSAPKATPAAPPAQKTAEGYIVQAGAFHNYPEAEKRRASIAFLGIRARIEAAKDRDKRLVYQVRIGPLDDADEAEALRRRLQQGNIQAVVLK